VGRGRTGNGPTLQSSPVGGEFIVPGWPKADRSRFSAVSRPRILKRFSIGIHGRFGTSPGCSSNLLKGRIWRRGRDTFTRLNPPTKGLRNPLVFQLPPARHRKVRLTQPSTHPIRARVPNLLTRPSNRPGIWRRGRDSNPFAASGLSRALRRTSLNVIFLGPDTRIREAQRREGKCGMSGNLATTQSLNVPASWHASQMCTVRTDSLASLIRHHQAKLLPELLHIMVSIGIAVSH